MAVIALNGCIGYFKGAVGTKNGLSKLDCVFFTVEYRVLKYLYYRHPEDRNIFKNALTNKMKFNSLSDDIDTFGRIGKEENNMIKYKIIFYFTCTRGILSDGHL